MKKKLAVFLLTVCVVIMPFNTAFATNEPNPAIDQKQEDQIRVIGVVKDLKGEPLIGVSVLVKNLTKGTITDVDGAFMINVSPKATLVFNYVGYVSQEIKVDGRTSLEVVLQEDEMMLDEVVAVGYGSQRKISSIGAQSGVKATTDLKQPVANLSTILAGRIAGVVARQENGEAGDDSNTRVWIRGISTTTSASPLVLVDGVERSWTSIDPEDLESFSVLKDASATAIYGVRGANGVILINTKRGVKGKPTVRMEVNHGITSFTSIPKMADGITYMQMANEASTNSGLAPVYTEEQIRHTYLQDDPYLYPNVNYMNEIFSKNGQNTRMNANVNGGSEFAQYYVSLGYYNEKGLYNKRSDEDYDGNMNFNRVNYVTNLTMQITKTTEAELGLKGEISDYNTPYYSASSIFEQVMNVTPVMYPVSYPDYKTPYSDKGYNVHSPYTMTYRYGKNDRNTSETRADLRIKQKLDFLIEGLSARILGAYDHYYRTNTRRKGNPILYLAKGRDEEGELILERTDADSGTDTWGYEKNGNGHRRYYMEAALDYSQIFNEQHRVSALFLYNMSDYANLTAGNLTHSIPYRSLGIAGRGTYSYADRYFVEANFGYNGADNFRPGRKFGFFPSFGVGWVATNETWFPKNDVLSFLKFRLSWGKAGNSNINESERFLYVSTVDGGTGFYFGQSSSSIKDYGGMQVGRYGVDVGWELSTKSNLGIDFNLFKDELSVQVDLFNEKRSGIFLRRASVPDFAGIVTMPYGNLGKVDNKGYEVTLDYNRSFGKVGVMFRANYSYAKNKIIDDGTVIKEYDWLNSRGTSLYTHFGYTCDGFYSQDDIDNPDVAKPLGVNVRPGDLKYRDLNKDGRIDANDKGYIGKPDVPTTTYGFGGTISYQGFSLGAFFQGINDAQFSLNNSTFTPFANSNAIGNLYSDITSRWTPENQGVGAKYPRLDYGLTSNPDNYTTSTFWLRDGSYLRLKTADISYTIPNKVVEKLGVRNVRIYLQGYNLLTFSKFKLWDPELGRGDGARYPTTRSVNMGCNFSF